MSQVLGPTFISYSRCWHLLDFSTDKLGFMAQKAAMLLMGKHKPIYDPAVDCGDYVVCINAQNLMVSGKKMNQKIYKHHSGTPGGLKEIRMVNYMQKDVSYVVKHAVNGMLPRNKTRRRRMERIFVFADDNHPYKQNIITTYVDPKCIKNKLEEIYF